MADGVDVAMDRVQTSKGDAVVDRPPTKPQGAKLRSRQNAVLARGERRDRALDQSRVIFAMYVNADITLDRHAGDQVTTITIHYR